MGHFSNKELVGEERIFGTFPFPEPKGNGRNDTNDQPGHDPRRAPSELCAAKSKTHQREDNTDSHQEDADPVESQELLHLRCTTTHLRGTGLYFD